MPLQFQPFLVGALFALTGFCPLLQGQERPVAVNFRTTNVSAMAAGDNAGFVPQTNWNDIDLGPVGELSGGAVFSPLSLVDSSGAASGITIQTTITTGYAADAGSLGSGSDAKMMRGALYLRQADSGTIQFSNISSALQTEGYDVFVYFEATTHPRDITVTLEGMTAQGLDQSVFNGTFIEGTGASVDSNYLHFRGLNAASLSMTVGTVTSSPRAGVTGIQIVPSSYTPPSPPVIQSFTAAPLVVSSATETTTLSWNVSGATSVSISPGVGSVSDSGTVVVTPGGDQTYTLTAINNDGTVTRELTVSLFNQNVPNIVIFIVDDYGWQDTSFEFWDTQTQWNQLYRTPGMDRLGSEGRAFTNAYASGPVCSCSRISILLGQAPVRHGTTFITNNSGNNSGTIRSAVQDNGGLDAEERTRTLPKILSNRGYRSINVGKAHFGPSNPLDAGFDRNRYGSNAGGPIGNGSNRYQQIVDGTQIHLSEALTIAAKEEVDDAVTDGLPFFLYLSHYAVHTPIIEDSRFTSNYPTVSGTTRAMATLIEGMDKSLNDLLDHLEAKGIAEKTLIFFMSDHGGLNYRGGSTFYNDPPAPNRKFNWPLRGGKNDAYEGGVRIPFFASWAKNDPTEPFQQALPISPGTKEDRPVIHADLLPTILQVTGYSSDVPAVVDGKDFSGYLTGDPNFVRENKFFWHAPNFWIGTTAKPDSAMREGDYKLVYTYDENEGIWELFDLSSDLGETTNLIDTQPEVGVRMARELITYLESENANYPTLISTGQELAPVLPSQASLVDLDGDGLMDSEEDANRNGMVDLGETDPTNNDTDSDGTPDGDEIRTGTDPLDSMSYFRADVFETSTPGEFGLAWPSTPGAVYRIEGSPELLTWTTLLDAIAADAGTQTVRTVSTPGSPSSYFFRVGLLP